MEHFGTTQSSGSPINVTIARIRFEHLSDALGIGVARPRLSWLVQTSVPGWIQAAYEIEAYTPDGLLFSGTGRVESSESVLVSWPFPPLASRQRLGVRVRTWGTAGQVSSWSELFPVEAALLDTSDWKANFITPDWEEDVTQPQPGPLLRKDFDLHAQVKKARLYITALGVYQVYLNGVVVGDHVMAPGWTSYHHRLRYQMFDVTDLLRAGPNALGAMLGDGWFRGRLGFGGGTSNIYGDRLALLAQLEVEYADGVTECIKTDETWRAATGPILFNDIYDGEIYDSRLEKPGWSKPGFNDSTWAGVKKIDWDLATLFAPLGPPVRATELVTPVAISTSPSGRTLVDFGQNLVGRLRISVQGPAGQMITLRHAEVLEHGELGTRPLRHAKATDCYILNGAGVETWEPRFTFHGFRYAEVEGWPGEMKIEDLRAVVCHSALERTGWFACSDPLINRLHENTLWSMRGNFLDIPTDCPQRDERLGWTGDIEVFSPTASFLYDSAGFLTSWLRDLSAEQKEYGGMPFVIPNVLPGKNPPAAAWGDAATVIPWVLYQRFGDTQVLADQFESMRAWVDLLTSIAGESRLWDKGFQLGDWLDPAAPPDNPAAARTPGFIIATAYFARSSELVGLAAGVLGKTQEEVTYRELAREVREAFNREYVSPTGRLLSDSSTAYALALQFSLLPTQAQRQHAGKRLAVLARANGFRISTGFVGTPLICDALCSEGLQEVAFRLLTARENPSWLYPVTMGATTIWERWDSMLPDGSINPGEMTSFNHYALGAVSDWMHRTIGGLIPAAPGYRRLEINPQPGGGLTWANAKHITPYGPAACAWKIAGEQITVEVEVPPNTSALIHLPGKPEGEALEVGSGKHSWNYAYRDQRAKHLRLTVDSTMGEIIDDNEALPLVLAAIRKYGTEVTDRMMAQEHLQVHQAVSFMPQGSEIIASVAEALASLNR
jgi:alpha-L-rhamnosidase